MLLYIEIDIESWLRTKHYDNRDHFNFLIVNFPFICCNLPAAPAYGLYISLLIQHLQTNLTSQKLVFLFPLSIQRITWRKPDRSRSMTAKKLRTTILLRSNNSKWFKYHLAKSSNIKEKKNTGWLESSRRHISGHNKRRLFETCSSTTSISPRKRKPRYTNTGEWFVYVWGELLDMIYQNNLQN